MVRLLSALGFFLALGGCAPPDMDPPDPADAPSPVPPSPTCGAYEFRGTTYDCDRLDRCDNSAENLTYRLACCDCDVEYCLPGACSVEGDFPMPPPAPPASVSSCMQCHNGAEDPGSHYDGPGMVDPHPGTASHLDCDACHGGDPTAVTAEAAHVAPPASIGDRANRHAEPAAQFRYVTLTGVEHEPGFGLGGPDDALDWLQFVNPGDLRVVSARRGCGRDGCHADEHADWMAGSLHGTAAGLVSGTTYAAGLPNARGDTSWSDTAADLAFREVDGPGTALDFGGVAGLDALGETAGFDDPVWAALDATRLGEDRDAAGRILPGTDLERVFRATLADACGGCHLGDRGDRHRYGDFRSSGCSACHMPIGPSGRYASRDLTVRHREPYQPDALAAPFRAHVERHRLRNRVSFQRDRQGQTALFRGIPDTVCATCHQGSNRTVLQFWGIRHDQNRDVARGHQYPADPASHEDASGVSDPRPPLFDPIAGNATFNGRTSDQLLVFEDYDGDGRDDTPPDVHFEKGMGCIDCHASFDLHGGALGSDPGGVVSRMTQGTAITCESCHGDIDGPPATVACVDLVGRASDCAVDRRGNPVRGVTADASGYYWLRSRQDGQIHHVPLVHDLVDATSGRWHPLTGEPLYSPAAAFAMGRVDSALGSGPLQADPTVASEGFAHTDTVSCVACHASWSNTCTGCHLEGVGNADPGNAFFSNATGERIALTSRSDFVYQSPVLFQIGIGADGKVRPFQPGMASFFRFTDLEGRRSPVLAFSDRHGNGAQPGVDGRGPLAALGHEAFAAHTVRGRTEPTSEGPRACNTCHLTDSMDLDLLAAQRDALASGSAEAFDFDRLRVHVGLNPNNVLNAPEVVLRTVGLGSGLFLFDAEGCPVNPLDTDANRTGCNGQSPAERFPTATPAFDLDRIVEPSGVANSSGAHPLRSEAPSPLRDGALVPTVTGPLGATLIERLTDPDAGIVLDTWLDADGVLHAP